jgi:Flp pilus assembly protein TadB
VPPEPHSISTNARIEELRAAETASLHRVQRRVAAIGFIAVAGHAVLGLIGVAYLREQDGRHADAVGLSIMSGVVAAIVYVVMRLILGGKLWSPAWIVVALAPSVAAVVWVLS